MSWGHAVRHALVLTALPWQNFAPTEGVGCVQVRWRTVTPWPQLELHWLHADHWLQPPSTGTVQHSSGNTDCTDRVITRAQRAPANKWTSIKQIHSFHYLSTRISANIGLVTLLSQGVENSDSRDYEFKSPNSVVLWELATGVKWTAVM